MLTSECDTHVGIFFWFGGFWDKKSEGLQGQNWESIIRNQIWIKTCICNCLSRDGTNPLWLCECYWAMWPSGLLQVDPLVGRCWEQHVIPQQSSSTSNAMFAALWEFVLAGRQTWFDNSALGKHNLNKPTRFVTKCMFKQDSGVCAQRIRSHMFQKQNRLDWCIFTCQCSELTDLGSAHG